jgi:hypothetical protein
MMAVGSYDVISDEILCMWVSFFSGRTVHKRITKFPSNLLFLISSPYRRRHLKLM